MIIAALLLGFLASADSTDPRPELARLQLDEQRTAALELVLTSMGSDPAGAAELGLPYLEAVLLLETERREAGLGALAEVISETPALAPWARLRLAREREKDGETRVAAALAAGLLAASPPKELTAPAVALLERSLAADGDCRVLGGLRSLVLKGEPKRRLRAAQAACAQRQGRLDEEKVILFDLLADDTADDVAQRAAERLLPLVNLDTLDIQRLERLGDTFYRHRVFETAFELLSRVDRRLVASRTLPKGWTARSVFETRYALARSLFWLGRYEEAAARFGNLAKNAPKSVLKAKSLYQQARCHELRGVDPVLRADAWTRALGIFEQARAADPKSGWASAGLIAAMRIEWLLGREEDALVTYTKLEATGRRDNAVRALIFLAASDLVQRRGDRAAAWLDRAARLNRRSTIEIDYWQARRLELSGAAEPAARAYLEVHAEDPYHPFAEAARRRLDRDPLRAVTEKVLDGLAANPDTDAKLVAWHALEPGPRRDGLAAELYRTWSKDPKKQVFLNLEAAPANTWPIWKRTAGSSPQELLLGLARFEELGLKPLRYFPVSDPSLALAASRGLATAGATRRSLYVAEILFKRLPDGLPLDWTPRTFQETLYPFGFSYWIHREAKKFAVDPYLLAGLIREESRFDADAFSGAAARGLTQFIYSTARDIASANAIPLTSAQDIHRPEIAVALGAAYLRHLSDELEGRTEAVVAAYNAGEPQSLLWQAYCLSDDPAEYWSKVAFKETRNYVRKVLKSRAHYRHLYGETLGEDASAESSESPP